MWKCGNVKNVAQGHEEIQRSLSETLCLCDFVVQDDAIVPNPLKADQLEQF
jgi:hypothetical protein